MSNFRNIYKMARKFSNKTQDQAAALLHISTRTLDAYENGEYIPPDEIVCSMAEIYGTRYLGYLHLKQSTEVGRRFLPEINITDLAKSVLKLQKEVGDLKQINSDMIEIACDGVVDKTEHGRLSCITKEIDEMAGAALAVSFAV
jgi:DNA-binding XRE family transcriptional regulator